METKDRKMVKPANAEKKAKSNGQEAKKSDNKANESKGQATPEPKPATRVLPIATASDRLSKFEQFQKLGGRYDFLKAKDNELKNFKVSQDGTLAKVTLACPGANVEISASPIIEKIVELCEQELDVLLKKAETEIVEFHI